MIGRRAPELTVPGWADQTGQAPDAGDVARAGPVGGSTRLQAALTRGLAAGLWVVIGLALVLGLVNCARTASSGAPAPQPEGSSSAAPVVPPAGGCAELAVAAWVAGDSAPLGQAPATTGPPPEYQRQAVRTHVASVDPAAAPERWGYLVAAQLRERDADQDGDAARGWRDLGTHYFAVTLVRADGGCHGWTPAAAPMQVAAPEPAAGATSPYTVALDSSDSELSATLEAFFRGMLTGAGGVERYTAPGASLPIVSPAPYQEVSITELRAWTGVWADQADGVPPDGTTVRLLATVQAAPAPLPLAYPVTVAVRGGRWEVVAVEGVVGAPDPQPALVSPSPTATATP